MRKTHLILFVNNYRFRMSFGGKYRLDFYPNLAENENDTILTKTRSLNYNIIRNASRKFANVFRNVSKLSTPYNYILRVLLLYGNM